MWQGRFDGDQTEYLRIFQKVQIETDYQKIDSGDFVLHGFAVDEGVRRNKGRQGAKDAPDVIRKNMSNFPVIHPDFQFKDFGNVFCEDLDLEKAQSALADKVAKVVSANAKSVVLGGGHEVMYAHYSGLKKAFPDKKIGIINIDAHFDNRTVDPEIGATSGTGFWQIAQEEQIHSLHLGIQKNSNTQKLFHDADHFGMNYILSEKLYFENLQNIKLQIDELSQKVDFLYLTVCIDVFNVSIAPGVSALAYNGIFADATFLQFFKHILSNPKLKAMDVAEVNPGFDIQERTARLAASLVNEWFMI